jgi:hypothetical protein
MADVQKISDAISAKLPLIVPTVAALLAVIFLQNVLNQRPIANLPVAGQNLGGDEKRRQAYLSKAADLYHEGYKKVGRLEPFPPEPASGQISNQLCHSSRTMSSESSPQTV